MKEMWDKKAASYSRFTGELSDFQKIFLAKLSEFGVEFKGKSLIDIGCGTGVHTLYIARLCSSVTGIDSSKEMLKIMSEDAKKFNIKNLRIVQSDFDCFSEILRYDIAFCTMSPAVSGEKGFDKFMSLGNERVYLWWNKPRYSSVLSIFYEIYGLKDVAPKPNGMEQFLYSRGIKFKSCILNEERVVARNFEQAAANVSWHLQIDGVKTDDKFIERELLSMLKNGVIEDKIVSSMKLLVF